MPRRFRIRLHNRRSSLRWKKGTCASTNPPVSLYRSKAPSICQSACDSALTSLDDEMSVCSSSAFTNCTNSTFSRIGIDRTQQKNKAVNKEIVAVLSSIADVIKENQDLEEDNDTAYFACLVTQLESDSISEITAAATLYLLSLVIKKVNPTILRERFEDTITVLTNVLKKFEKSEQTILLRSWIRCFSYTLKCQSTEALAQLGSYFSLLFRFMSDSRHRVRKSCHIGIAAVLNNLNDREHPLIGLTCEHCKKQLDMAGFRDAGMIASTLLLYRSIIHCMDKEYLLSICECLLKLMTHGDLSVRMQCLQVLSSLFQSKNSGIDMDTNCKLINALYTCQPNVNEHPTFSCWITVMTVAHQSLFTKSTKFGWLHLPRFARVAVNNLRHDRKDVVDAASNSIEAQIWHCMQPSIDEQTVDDNALGRWVNELCTGFNIKFHLSWLSVFKLFGDLLGVLKKPHFPLVQKYIELLGRLRSGTAINQGTMDTKELDYEHQRQIDYAVSNAIRTFGPDLVLSQIPMGFNSTTNKFVPTWLFDLLRKSVRETRLQYFVQFFLPRALDLRKNSPDSPAECDIWSLFPGFCNNPVDSELFGQVSRGIGVSLAKCNAIRPFILRGLANIIQSAENDEKLAGSLRRDAKNFLPILFNVYMSTDTPVDVRSLSQQVIANYCPLVDRNLLEVFFNKAMEKQRAASTALARKLLLELIMCFVPVLEDKHEIFYELAFDLIKKPGLQKRGYRLMQKLLECSNSSSEDKSESVISLLKSTRHSVTPDAKHARFLCVRAVLDQCTVDDVFSFFDEALLSVVERNSRASKAAVRLSTDICRMLMDKNETQSDTDLVYKLLVRIESVTLLNQPDDHSRQCCVTSLTYLIRQFKECIVGNNALWLLDRVKSLLKEGQKNDQLFARSCVLCSSLIKCLEPMTLLSSLDSLLRAIFVNHKGHGSRAKRRLTNVLAIMARKLGFEVVSARVPVKDETVSSMLRNLRKSLNKEEKQKKKTEEKTVDPESESSSIRHDERSAKSSKRSSKSKKARTKAAARQDELWIDERDGEPLDLLDTQSLSKFVYTAKKSDNLEEIKGFKIDSTGRIVVKEDEEEENKAEDSSDEDIEDRFDTLSLTSKRHGRKRQAAEAWDRKSSVSAKSLHSGSAYKAKRARGDIRKKNALEPYAYVQLTTGLLNKRKRRQAGDQFKNAIKRAKIGAQRAARTGLKANRGR